MERDAAVALFQSMGEKYKAEIIASIPSNEPIGLYGQGEWFDLCRGPHVPSTGKLEGFQAHEGRRRLLARRLTQRDAPAHLRHRVAQRQGARRPTCTGSKKPRSATTAASARISTCSTSRKRRRAPCSGIRRAGRIFQQLIGYMRKRAGRGRLRRSQRAGDHGIARCGSSQATSRSSARTCS